MLSYLNVDILVSYFKTMMRMSLTALVFNGFPLLQHIFLKLFMMFHDHPTFCLSSPFVPRSSDSELQNLKVPFSQSQFVPPNFYSFQLLLFVFVHCTVPQTQNETWFSCYCFITRFLPFPSLILKNICIFVFVHISVIVSPYTLTFLDFTRLWIPSSVLIYLCASSTWYLEGIHLLNFWKEWFFIYIILPFLFIESFPLSFVLFFISFITHPTYQYYLII